MATYRRQVDPHVIGNLLRSHSSRIVVRMFRSVIPPDAPPWRPRLPQPIGVLGVRKHGFSQAGEARHGGELLPEGLGRPGQKRRFPQPRSGRHESLRQGRDQPLGQRASPVFDVVEERQGDAPSLCAR